MEEAWLLNLCLEIIICLLGYQKPRLISNKSLSLTLHIQPIIKSFILSPMYSLFISLHALKLFQCVTGLGTGLLLSPFWWHLWVMDWKTGHGPAVGSGVWSRVRPWASMVKIPSFLFSWCTSRKHFLNPPFKIKKHGRGCLQRGQIEPSVRVEWKPRKQK